MREERSLEEFAELLEEKGFSARAIAAGIEEYESALGMGLEPEDAEQFGIGEAIERDE